MQDLEAVPRRFGVAMSGGGFRAAAFHLGALSYLAEAQLEGEPLIERVVAISTVSGGTFTGCRFALSQVDNESFDDFFRDFYRGLRDVRLVPKWLQLLGGHVPEVPSRRQTLITAAAQAYAEAFFSSRRDGTPRRFGEILQGDTKLSVIFNATDFRNGIAFRFQRSPRGKIGNRHVSLTPEEAGDIRLADIVAASSCFPGGFEPIAFPDDFVWSGTSNYERIKAKVYRPDVPGPDPIALMDGGVYDNQGTESLWLASEGGDEDLDVLIISDVDRPSDDYYRITEVAEGGLTLGTLYDLGRLVLLGCVVSVPGLALLAGRALSARALGEAVTTILALIVVASVGFSFYWLRTRLPAYFAKIPQSGRAAWTDIRKLRLGQVIDLIELRVGSLGAMASSIFMRRVRALGNKLLHASPVYHRRVISCYVYHLSGDDFDLGSADVVKTSPQLRHVCERAAEVPTKLWFDDGTEQPDLVVAGQATLCYNLLKYIHRHWTPESRPTSIQSLWAKLRDDWRRFNEDPYWLLRSRFPGKDDTPAP